MSFPPIEIPNLDPAGPIDRTNDLMLVRQGLNDKKATVSQISEVQMGEFPVLGTTLLATDMLFLGRNAGGGNYTNYAVQIQKITFLDNVKMWFYAANPPLYWTLQAIGDKLLAVARTGGPSYAYNVGGTAQGNWQQEDVDGVLNRGLSITQIPNHNHYTAFGRTQSNSNARFAYGSQSVPDVGDPKFGVDPTQNPGRGIVAGKGDNPDHNNYGQCDPHDHGNSWRPDAYVGCIGIKST